MEPAAKAEIIQGIVTRLAGNSFSIKTWNVGLVTALLGLASQGANHFFALVAIYPIVVFWCLDAYYLAAEQVARDWKISFTGDMPKVEATKVGLGTWFDQLFNATVLPLYASSIVAALLVAFAL